MEDVDGMPERDVVSSRSPTEEIGLRRVPATMEKGDNGHSEGELSWSVMKWGFVLGD